jgi:hypothetical protein
LGADRTIQVSVSPNTMLDKIIQMPTKPAHDFSGLENIHFLVLVVVILDWNLSVLPQHTHDTM